MKPRRKCERGGGLLREGRGLQEGLGWKVGVLSQAWGGDSGVWGCWGGRERGGALGAAFPGISLESSLFARRRRKCEGSAWGGGRGRGVSSISWG